MKANRDNNCSSAFQSPPQIMKALFCKAFMFEHTGRLNSFVHLVYYFNFNNLALMATITVLKLINTAP